MDQSSVISAAAPTARNGLGEKYVLYRFIVALVCMWKMLQLTEHGHHRKKRPVRADGLVDQQRYPFGFSGKYQRARADADSAQVREGVPVIVGVLVNASYPHATCTEQCD